jgi:hypothetical protein
MQSINGAIQDWSGVREWLCGAAVAAVVAG